MSDVIKVDIWSDVQCPWCYIGKRRFEAALEQFDGEVEVEYRSFELAPDTPVDYSGTTADYLSERKGLPIEQVHHMLANVTAIAESVGLEYHLDRAQQTNTIKAHELLHFAKSHGLQRELKERLLAAYFVESRHVGRIGDLLEIAEEVGLDPQEAERALIGGEYRAAVKADVAQAQQYGIQGVPFFVFDGKYGISGAQEPQVFLNALDQVVTDRENSALDGGV